MAGTVTFTNAIQRRISKFMNLGQTITPDIDVQTGGSETIAGSLTLTPTLTRFRLGLRTLSASMTLTAALARVIRMTRNLAITLTPARVIRVGKFMNTPLTFSFTMNRKLFKTQALNVTLVPTIVASTATTYFRTFEYTINFLLGFFPSIPSLGPVRLLAAKFIPRLFSAKTKPRLHDAE
jgi:hypothetical protein